MNEEEKEIKENRCTKIVQANADTDDGDCEVCQPVETYENILDNFCRADVVVKTRVKKQRKNKVICKKARVYKSEDSDETRLALRRPRFSLTAAASCCQIKASRTAYLIMARRKGQDLVPTFVMPFRKSKPLRMALKKFRGLDCSDPQFINGGLDIPTLSQEPPQRSPHQKRPKKGRKKPKGRRGRKRGRVPRPPSSSSPEGADGAMGPALPSPASYPTSALATYPPPSPPPSPVLESDQSLRFLQENEVEGHTPPSIDPPTQLHDADTEADEADGDAEGTGNADGEGAGGKRRGRKRGRRQRNKAARRDRRRKDKKGEQAEATPEP
ncbi:uncharacterized protein LOC122255326 [Penaeus japonicus]|uniref:uncharacterized protein LOC122255326 n=1 Tax=Penaeus japonicus TaxID=27405 RepID=UPI001C712827|nr:uncharacterized protein LOC122255326 [Penaeus japonicus]